MNKDVPGTKLPGGDRPRKEDVKRLFTKEQFEIWDKINKDEQLKAILAKFTLSSVEAKSKLVPANVKDFLRKYPTLEEFESAEGESVGMDKMAEFKQIMYGRIEE